MSDLRWDRVKELFSAALELEPARRSEFLERECAGDLLLRRELESLLASHEDAGGFLASGLLYPPVFRLDAMSPGAMAGRRAGPYELVEEIGRGGMGVVYRAVRADGQYEAEVAVKLVRADLETGFSLERFQRERQILASLNHPHIAGLLDAGVTGDGIPYFVMELVPGLPIDRYCERESLGVNGRLELFRQVCLAVHHAHQHLVIHRDIKPGNILVTAEGVPKLLDFGIAKLLAPEDPADRREETATAMRLMTLEYASPEQVKGAGLTTATDVYSLGVLLYRLLAGESPYRVRDRSLGEMVIAICEQEPHPPSAAARGDDPKLRRLLRGDVDNIVLRSIRKEPSQRYDSARALADDIGRHLAGEPVHARGAGLLYRLGKKLARHRLAVAVTLAALLAGLVFGLLWLEARRGAAEQVRAAQIFGGEVERMGWILRTAHLLPRHDVRREKAMVRQRMDWIRGRIQALGAAGAGPGEYALGQGHLSLDEYADARAHLERAMQSGYRRPEVEGALGLVLAELYRKEKSVVDRIGNPRARQVKQREIEDRFLRPALACLRQADRSAVTAPELVSARVAHLERRYGDAARLARAAVQRVPWLYEAFFVEGDASMDLAMECRDQGDDAGEMAAYRLAEAAYEQAVRLGPSDAGGYLRLCHYWKNRMFRELIRSNQDPSDWSARAIAAAEQGIAADPEYGEIYSHIADVHWVRGEWELRSGRDPTGSLGQAVEAGRRSVAINKVAPNALSAIGTALFLLAQYQEGIGRDGGPALRESIESYRRGAAQDPDNLNVLSGMGNACRILAEYQLERGQDPRGALRESIRQYERLLAIVPDAPNTLNNMGIAHQVLGQYALRHGLDPSRDLREAARFHRRALELNPKHSFAANNLGNDLQIQGLWEMSTGADPSRTFAETEAAFRAATRINPEDAIPYLNLVDYYRFRAEFQRMQGRSPHENLAPAGECFRLARRYNPEFAENYFYMGAVHLAVARHELDAGRTPLPSLEAARRRIAEGLGIDGRSAEGRQLAGETALLEARWALAVGRPAAAALARADAELARAAEANPAEESILRDQAELCRWQSQSMLAAGDRAAALAAATAGLDKVRQALAVNPASAEAAFARGALELARGRVLADPVDAARAFGRARADLESAVKANRWLGNEAGPLLAEIRRRLAGSTPPPG